MRIIVCLILTLAACTGPATREDPLGGHLNTRWAEQVSAENVLPEYPRPQMVRTEWRNLNGLWDYALNDRDAPRPEKWDGEILVPFAVESALSGVKKAVGPEQRLWYRTSFTVPSEWNGQRLLLHFGAVDWQAEVFVNGARAGEHRGGYTPFSFDVSEHLKPGGEQELVVAVWDPTDTGTQPRGKQVLEPQGIWYTAVTGIWQTVWIEPVAEVAVTRLKLEPDIDEEVLNLTVFTDGAGGPVTVRAVASDSGAKVAEIAGQPGAVLQLKLDDPKLWSPSSPHLYDLQVDLERDGQKVDEVTSYFGMRKIALGRDTHGRNLLYLNNEPLFQLGPLDQGWWPDGLYTAPTDEALRYDIEITKKLGFNMARKHVKVEPARWYHHCDKLGLLVWQDMPSAYLGGRGPGSLFVAPEDENDADRDAESAAQFEAELQEMIDAFGQFPSIVLWVPFNEGWGQYDTARIADWIKKYDPSRMVDATSGWTDRGVGDMHDTHIYPGPGMRQDVGVNRASVLGEFGGLGWPVEGHLWWNKRNWGYRTLQSREAVNDKYEEVVSNVVGLRGFGLAAAIYTQTTDVEGEVNGLMTYDRQILKYDEERLRRIHGRLYMPATVAEVLADTSKLEGQRWRYTVSEPAAGWETADFDAASWDDGEGPFQSGDYPIFRTGTKWTSASIWLRRDFQADETPANLWLELLDNVSKGKVYLNGELVLETENPGGGHREWSNYDLSSYAKLVRAGRNVIAIQAERGDGRCAIDGGLYTVH